MANHRADSAAALVLLIASILMAVALSSADASPTVLADKTPTALPVANAAGSGAGSANATTLMDPVDQELCNDCEEPKAPEPPCSDCEEPRKPDPPCSDCEEPKKPEPPCSGCEEEPKEKEMKCNKAHAVRDGETCYSMGECAGLAQDDFMRFNPNICCDNLFVGQWVCLDATCADDSD